VAELPRLGQSRTTLVTVTSMRRLHRLVLLNFAISVVTLTMTLLARGGL